MLKMRYFIHSGDTPEKARLQYWDSSAEYARWVDVPMVCENPDDEMVECPRLKDTGEPAGVCQLCWGTGWVRKGDLR
jgi:hypothetical protein